MQALRRLASNPALGPTAVIWAFGYLLVDIFAFLLGRAALGLNMVSSVPLFALGVGLTLLLDQVRQRLEGKGRVLRLLVLGIAIVAATAIQTAADLNYIAWLSLTLFPDWQAWALNFGQQRVFTVGLLYLWTLGLALTVFWAGRSHVEAQASAARAAASEAATHRAEAAALRLQLNPHFLFNALNSISSLVTLDRKPEAEAMIDQLADFLRASLASDPMADVSLASEIDTIDAYLSIEAVRFGDRLSIDIDVPDSVMGAMVPNFILQPLVENAIKHGAAAHTGPASIRIAAGRDGDALVLSVVNSGGSGPGSAQESQRKGIGLANIRQRLAIGYGNRARLENGPVQDGYRAAIRLPFVNGSPAISSN